jgi:hypothetical protein
MSKDEPIHLYISREQMKILQELLDSLKIDLPVTAGVVGSHLMAVASQRLGLATHLHSQGQSDADVSEEGVGTLTGGAFAIWHIGFSRIAGSELVSVWRLLIPCWRLTTKL